MKEYINLILIIAGFILSACNKDNPYVPKSVIYQLIENNKNKLCNIAIIYNNDIYLLPRADSIPQRITNSPSLVKTNIKISHNHKKIAYLDVLGHPVVINNYGNNIANLTQFSNIKSMDWSSNDSTLYMLIGNQLYYYGNTLQLPAFTYTGVEQSSQITVLCVTVSMNNDLAYVFQAKNNNWGNYWQKLIVKKNDGTSIEINNNSSGLKMVYANFSGNGTDLVIGYSDLTSTQDISKVELYKEINNYVSKFENGVYNFASYRSDENNMICISPKANGAYYEFVPTAFNLSDNSNIKFTQFDNTTNPLFVDWK